MNGQKTWKEKLWLPQTWDIKERREPHFEKGIIWESEVQIWFK